MATDIKFIINNDENPNLKPYNAEELEIELNFDRDKGTFDKQVGINNLEFVRDGNDTVIGFKDAGLTTGVGVFEGLPLKIEISRNGAKENVFDGYIDMTEATFDRVKTSVKVTEKNQIDWLNDVADSFSFDYLYKEVGSITQNDFIKVPYIINSVPNYVESAIAVISAHLMVKEIKDVIQKMIEFTNDLPMYYVFSTYVKIVLYIIYLIGLIIALVKLIKQMITLMIQPVKYHAAMTVKKHLEKGCEHLGLNFRSPILEEEPFNELVIMPEKYYNPITKKEEFLIGIIDPKIEQFGYYKGTFGDVIRLCKTLFNAKVLIKDNTLWLLRRDDSITQSNYTLPDIYNPSYRLNTNEFKSNTLISFTPDLSDKNTIQNYLGNSYQVIIKPKTIINESMVLMKGLEDIRIQFARGTIKTDLTLPEKVLSAFLKVFNTIIGAIVKVVNVIINVLNKIITAVNNILKKLANIGIKVNFRLPSIPTFKTPNFGDLIENRKGMLMIEKDNFAVPKLLLITEGKSAKFNKLNADSNTLLSAKYLYENYHFINSFIPSTEKQNANQWVIKNYEKVPFSFDDYLLIKQNNIIFTADNQLAEVDSLKWNPFSQTANMTIRINKLYTNNLRTIYLEPDGQ